MPSKADIEIVCVPPVLLGATWQTIGGHLLRGQLVITGGEVEAALMRLAVISRAVQAGVAQVWAVFDREAKECLAAMVTEICDDDDGRVLWVTGLAGKGVMSWGSMMSDRLAEFAKDENCRAFRFHGRWGSHRAYKDVTLLEAHPENGVHLFERAVA